MQGFYTKLSMKCSLKIALAIATSAATIKAEEICSSKSCKKQLKIRQVKRENKSRAEQHSNSFSNRAGSIALLLGGGYEV